MPLGGASQEDDAMNLRILKVGFAGSVLLALVGSLVPGGWAEENDRESRQSSPALVWPLPPEQPRIRYLEQFSNNFDIEPRKKLSWLDRLIGKPDPNVVEFFEKPAGVAADSRGRILIASLQRSTVFILDKKNRKVTRLWGDRGIRFINPLGLEVDREDNIYVSDPLLRMVLKFDPSGRLLATVGQEAGLRNPVYLELDEPRRRLFVVDSHLHQVLVYDLDTLKLITRVGQRGDKDGEFNFPVGIGVGPDGYFAVSDTGSCSVQIFSPDFEFVRRFGRQGLYPGMFVRPKDVAFDSEGHIYVVDAAFNNFQIFNRKGEILLFVGSFGGKPGEFSLPNGIYVDDKDRIYVSDQLNHRVQIFQFLGGNGPRQWQRR